MDIKTSCQINMSQNSIYLVVYKYFDFYNTTLFEADKKIEFLNFVLYIDI